MIPFTTPNFPNSLTHSVGLLVGDRVRGLNRWRQNPFPFVYDTTTGNPPFLLGFMAQLAWIWLVLVSVFQVAYSKETDRSHWTEPDGSKDGNFLTSYHPGDSIRVGWVGWDSSFTDRLMDKSSKANLYVNAWNSNYSSFVKIISCT